MSSVLIATLGAEPQVVSLTTALLLAQNVSLQAVIVLHTDPQRAPIDQALPRLDAAFAVYSGVGSQTTTGMGQVRVMR